MGKPLRIAELRERFEWWVTDGGKWPNAIQRDDRGGYLLLATANQWSAWCGCAHVLNMLIDDEVSHGG